MTAIPEPIHTTVNRIYDAYVKADKNEHRPHLGASVIGENCERRNWYKFRWALKEVHDGRMLRLFATGHLAEPRFIKDLRDIGCEVEYEDEHGRQYRVHDFGGHFGGAMDALVRNLPEAPKTWHVGEFKTHSQKSFDALVKHGVKKHKPNHYAQVQIYMGYTDLKRAIYLAVNKNTDELYSERIEFDPVAFASLKARALRIIEAPEPLPRISSDPSAFECKYCEFKPICHGDRLPEVNCRTCTHSTPVTAAAGGDSSDGGPWRCEVHNDNVPLDFQRQGCSGHRYIPIFCEKSARAIDYRDGVVIYEVSDNRTFGNGDGSDGTITSEEMRVAGGLDALPECAEVKRQVKTARVVA